jgi:hypothetical protein
VGDVDPHARDLARVRAECLQNAAACGLLAAPGDHEAGGVRRPDAGVEALGEALVELGCVAAEAPAGVRGARILELDREQRAGEQVTDLVLGAQEPLALVGAERGERGRGQLIGDAVDLAQLGLPCPREREQLGAAVGGIRDGVDEPVALQRAEHAREIAGVEAEPGAQVTRSGALEADFEEDTRFAERSPPEMTIADDARLTGDEPVEAPNACDVRLGDHSLTWVRE